MDIFVWAFIQSPQWQHCLMHVNRSITPYLPKNLPKTYQKPTKNVPKTDQKPTKKNYQKTYQNLSIPSTPAGFKPMKLGTAAMTSTLHQLCINSTRIE
jgi:hypothetical protein